MYGTPRSFTALARAIEISAIDYQRLRLMRSVINHLGTGSRARHLSRRVSIVTRVAGRARRVAMMDVCRLSVVRVRQDDSQPVRHVSTRFTRSRQQCWLGVSAAWKPLRTIDVNCPRIAAGVRAQCTVVPSTFPIARCVWPYSIESTSIDKCIMANALLFEWYYHLHTYAHAHDVHQSHLLLLLLLSFQLVGFCFLSTEKNTLLYKDSDEYLLIFLRPTKFYPESAFNLVSTRDTRTLSYNRNACIRDRGNLGVICRNRRRVDVRYREYRSELVELARWFQPRFFILLKTNPLGAKLHIRQC